mmetsp:Transcript_29608/g.51995  ORF Transcript_29608/g.51995 Transcript_29608/m.51995 type:complete len:368 (-) Transcript_29608:411-1514(-)
MDLEDSNAALEVGEADLHAAVETARTEKGRVKHIGTVSGSEDDDAGVALESVHLCEDLVQGLFTLVVASGNSGSTLATDGIDFINEDDARGVLLSHLEQVADTGSTHTDEELNELGTGGGHERNSSLTGGGTGEEGLTGTRRAFHDDSLRNLGSKLSEFLRVLEELDDFHKLLLCFVVTGNLVESHSSVWLHFDLGAGTSELGRVDAAASEWAAAATCTTLATLVATGEEEADDGENNDRNNDGSSEVEQRVRLLVLGRKDSDLDVVLTENLEQVKGHGNVSEAVEAAFLVDGAAGGSILGEGNLFDLVVHDSIDKLEITKFFLLRQLKVRLSRLFNLSSVGGLRRKDVRKSGDTDVAVLHGRLLNR